MTLAQKLHPKQFTAMSSKMAAIVAAILGESWTNPALRSFIITSDGFVLAERTGDVGANEFIGAVDEFEGNIRRLLDAAELSEEERADFYTLYAAITTDHRSAAFNRLARISSEIEGGNYNGETN